MVVEEPLVENVDATQPGEYTFDQEIYHTIERSKQASERKQTHLALYKGDMGRMSLKISEG